MDHNVTSEMSAPSVENVERRMTESLVYYMLAYKSVHTRCDSSPISFQCLAYNHLPNLAKFVI